MNIIKSFTEWVTDYAGEIAFTAIVTAGVLAAIGYLIFTFIAWAP